jgi:hypothetical protein
MEEKIMSQGIMTYADALSRIGTDVPAHLEADAEVPVLTGVMQRQGDLLILPVAEDKVPAYRETPAGNAVRPGVMNKHWERKPLANDGHRVVRGEATGNTHWLHNGFDSQIMLVERHPGTFDEGAEIYQFTLCWFFVPDSQSAMLVHTDEHGANAFGPGWYEIRQRRQQNTGAVIRSGD